MSNEARDMPPFVFAGERLGENVRALQLSWDVLGGVQRSVQRLVEKRQVNPVRPPHVPELRTTAVPKDLDGGIIVLHEPDFQRSPEQLLP